MRWLVFLVVACGAPEETRAPTISIDGTSHVLKSALLRGSHLVLSTGTSECTAWHLAEIMLSRSELGWTLGGTTRVVSTAKADALKDITIGDRSGGTAAVTLGGGGMVGAHRVELAGTIQAIDCTD